MSNNEELLGAIDAGLAVKGGDGSPGITEVIDFSGQLKSGGVAFDFLAGMSKFALDRFPGYSEVLPPIPDTMAARVGEAAFPVATGVGLGIATGGASLPMQAGAQALLAGGTEAARAGASPGDVALAGTLGGVLTAGGNLTARVMTSLGKSFGRTAKRVVKSEDMRPIIDFADDLRGGFVNSLARVRSGAGAFNFALKNNIKAMNERVAKIFDFSDSQARAVTEIGDDFLGQARRTVNRNYKNAEPSEIVDVAAVRELLETIPERLTPGVKDTLNMIDDYAGQRIPAVAWQPMQRMLRDTASDLRAAPDGRAWARVADDAIDQLDLAGANAGGNRALMGKANQQFKMLATLEEINAVVEAGEIPAGQLVRLMGRNNFKGFGRRAIAEGLPDNVMPEIAEVLRAGKQMAKFSRDIAGGSATAGRQATFGPAQTSIQGLLSGELSLGQAGAKAASGILTPGLGRATTEVGGAGTRAVAGAAGQAGAQAPGARVGQ